jgi:hypothetical protein
MLLKLVEGTKKTQEFHSEGDGPQVPERQMKGFLPAEMMVVTQA